MNKSKIIAILPAYNAEKTLEVFLASLPKEYFDEVILVDDCSTDDTFSLAKKHKNISVYQTLRNLGYGGNLKMCLGLSLERGADIIVELHPDAEYGFNGIIPAIEKVKKGAKFILGNRFANNPLNSGMPLWKYPFTRLLTFLDNIVLGTSVNDMHQGFRVYTRELLKSINFRASSNDYIFSFEIISQMVFHNIPIDSVPVSTSYKGKKRGASFQSGIIYSIGTFKVLSYFILAKLGLRSKLFKKPGRVFACPNCKVDYLVEYLLTNDGFNLYFCKICQNGFTYPIPQSMDSYYPKNYWSYQEIVGYLRKVIFNMFQKRRKKWLGKFLPDGGLILDVGSGEGNFAKDLPDKYQVVSLEASFAKLDNNQVIKADFLQWHTNKLFDTVCFWESLEHIPNPQKYLEKASKLLKKNGLLFVEYPRYNSLERKLFGRYWFHLDLPRHLTHFTDAGLQTLCHRVGLKNMTTRTIFAGEYAPAGFFLSLIKGNFRWNWILASPLLLMSLVVSLMLFLIGQSPIGLVVAKKEKA